MIEINPSQLRGPFCERVRTVFRFMQKRKRLAEKTYGARNQAYAENDPKKDPENELRFRGSMSNQTRMSLHPSSIQTITVGSGVTPDPVLRLRSALVGCTTDREFTCTDRKCHPAPKVFI